MEPMKTMTLVEISELLKISVQTARTRVRNGKAMPPSFRAGQRRLFLISEVQKWLDVQTGAAGEKHPQAAETLKL
jgi:predicted site-specific integrase-resolvase